MNPKATGSIFLGTKGRMGYSIKFNDIDPD
jgi:hypothetical protein